MPTRRSLILSAATIPLVTDPQAAWAQATPNWPVRPVRVIVNYAPGGIHRQCHPSLY